jgi:MinD-like ATPase involved in chromosome partitioning or flagellar assembly
VTIRRTATDQVSDVAIVAVAGDLTTTTSVALAAGWPVTDDTLLVEADPAGGDLAAWFDLPVTPSLSTIVTRVVDGAWPDIEQHTRLASNGLRLVPAPAGAAEAAQAVGESARALVPSLAALRSPVTIADVGRLPSTSASHPFLGAAAAVVLVHRQAPQSARAAAVRLQRLADQLVGLTASPTPVVVAVVGERPFDLSEIERFLLDAAGVASLVGLPDDPLAAAVFAGRTGVSARRLARLPLVRAARDLADVVERSVMPATGGLWRSAR